jgi:putative ABC transport system ATP-binding protein
MDTSPYIIETEDLWRIYPLRSKRTAQSDASKGAGDGKGIPALRGVNLQVKAGEFVLIKGRSGSGKTTLLNCLAGLDRPTSGIIRVLGHDLAAMSETELTIWRREKIGLIFQSFGLLPTLSAYENVELLLRIKGEDAATRHKRTLECLDLVKLSRWRNHRPYEMSGGQQQRLAIARALANRANLILADEPTGELDSRTTQDLLSTFRTLVEQEKITLLMVSHDPLADHYAQKILMLKDGVILGPDEVTQQSSH